MDGTDVARRFKCSVKAGDRNWITGTKEVRFCLPLDPVTVFEI